MAKKTKKEQSVEDLLAMEMSIIEKYKKPFIIACVAIVSIVGIVAVWNWHTNKVNNAVWEALYPGESYFRSGQYDLALNGDSIGYEGFVSLSNGSTPAANMACAYAGLSYAQKGEWADAVTYLEKYSLQDDQTITPAVLCALGNCYANTGDIDKAVSTLEKAAKKACNGSLAPSALKQAADLCLGQGKADKARELYTIIKNDYPQSVQAANIDKSLLRVAE